MPRRRSREADQDQQNHKEYSSASISRRRSALAASNDILDHPNQAKQDEQRGPPRSKEPSNALAADHVHVRQQEHHANSDQNHWSCDRATAIAPVVTRIVLIRRRRLRTSHDSPPNSVDSRR